MKGDSKLDICISVKNLKGLEGEEDLELLRV